MTKNLCLSLLVLCGATACDTSRETAQTDAGLVATGSAEAIEITWEQLMPKGEEERLAELYANYYAELDKRLALEAQSYESADSSSPESGDVQDLIAAIIEGTPPSDTIAAIPEGSPNDTMEQIGTFNVVDELNGLTVRLPGYVVPFDFSAQATYREFLLVPYFGACIHTPPPPPNQIVLVKADPAASVADIYEPVWVEGVLRTGQFNSDLADSAYELTLNKVEAYVY
ncbi:MAG: DUF3299 domain-containing protein [Gammaproteobacteria bacterium]|nr:DUF3299 domain-containing protein [Gammaproteobacteria bacterium]